tara:strand:+ start:835 stop:2661 length:1827 start_codon:yes stop_codon:yes gene_type:complete
MYRYVALTWDQENAQAREAVRDLIAAMEGEAEGWRKVLAVDGFMVWHVGEREGRMQTYLIRNDAGLAEGGAVLGKLFKRATAQHLVPTCLDGPESHSIIHTKGRHLTTNYWGRYVAFIRDEKGDGLNILRDPIGSFPCYYMRYRMVEIYFSYMPDIRKITGMSFSINWDHVAHFMAYGPQKTEQTGLGEVSELLPGQCLETPFPDNDPSFYWSPADIARNDPLEDIEQAARELRQTTRHCVAAWAACYSNVFHNLSGGLDSAIVLNCLKQAAVPPRISCINYFTEERQGDERCYARLAAEQAGVPLYETCLSSANISLRRVLRLIKEAKPGNYLYERARDHFEPTWIREIGAEACFYGSGGDNVFFQPETYLGAVDFVQSHGLRSLLWRVALEAARLDRRSVWSVLTILLKQCFLKSYDRMKYIRNGHKTSLMAPDLIETLDSSRVLHPVLRMEEHIPPGKFFHIFIATSCPDYYEPLERKEDFLEPVLPLFSQPIVELCLRIPIWIMTAGGRERGLARRAFSDHIPQEIVRREAKGGADILYHAVLKRNLPFVKEMLLDGLLVRQGLLQRKGLEKVLSGDDHSVSAELVKILFHVGTEAWARDWYKG